MSVPISFLPGEPRIAVHRDGPPDGRAVLFAHCFSGGAWMWTEHFFELFATRGFAPYAVDYRGHGRSGGGEAVGRARLADYQADLAAAVDFVAARHDGTPAVIGHSIGSLLTRLLAAERELPAFALLGFGEPSIAFPKFFGWCLRRFPLSTAKMLMTGRSDAMWARAGPHRAVMFANKDAPKIDGYVERLRSQPESNVIFDEVRKLKPIPPAAGNPRVLIGAGDRDVLASPRSIDALAAAYPDCRVIRFPGLAHDVSLSTGRERVIAALFDWLEGQAG